MARAVIPQNQPLLEHDPELHALIQKEAERQLTGLEMIASENFTSRAVLECLGSVLTNKYSEGTVGHRYYGGNEFIDEVETLAINRALQAFGLDPEEWGVSVQPYSGSTANFAAFAAILNPHDRLMGLDLPHGGHLSHGFYLSNTRKVNISSIVYESLPYRCNDSGLIDYDALQAQALLFQPKLIVAGASAYPREFDYARFRAIADSVGAYLLMDMAHYAGLIAGGVMQAPFPHCDIVTSTTHKSLRGPRAGVIFYRKKSLKGEPTDLHERVNQAVFPRVQGGPHNHQIAGIATQMKEVCSPEWKTYAKQVVVNAQALANGFTEAGQKIMTNGTDTHLILWDLRPHDMTGSKMERVLELANISVNKNSLAGDKSMLNPGGVRIGSPALTSRGLQAAEFRHIVTFYLRALEICKRIQGAVGKKLVDFVAAAEHDTQIKELRADVIAFASSFPMPGYHA